MIRVTGDTMAVDDRPHLTIAWCVRVRTPAASGRRVGVEEAGEPRMHAHVRVRARSRSIHATLAARGCSAYAGAGMAPQSWPESSRAVAIARAHDRRGEWLPRRRG